MPNFVADSAFDMSDLLETGSLSEFFDDGDVVQGTDTTFVVDYVDPTISERLVLTGAFGDYVDGYPTTGTITGASYTVDGVTLFTISEMSMSVGAFTAYVMNDNLQGLFDDMLSGADVLTGSDGDDTLLGFGGDDTLRGGFGADHLSGGDGNDFLSESQGDYGPFSDDVYDGGAGIDRVSYFINLFAGTVTANLNLTGAQATGQGNDTLIGIEHITSTYGDDTLIGNGEANWFWTFSGFDRLTGNGGNDYFTVGAGDKIADGGSGIDTIEIADFAYEPVYTS